MSAAATPYPLQWPLGRPRRRSRVSGRFAEDGKPITISRALGRLDDEIQRIGGTNAVLSSNLQTNLSGAPRSGQAQPRDVGVALYFQLKGRPICMPCDTYDRAEQNIAAIAAHIEATRKIERHGVATVAEMFSGFVALPASERAWWDVLQCRADATRDIVEAQFRRLAQDRHPDRGGSDAAMAELNRARAEALKDRRQ